MTREHCQQEREAFNAFCDGKEIETQSIGDDKWYACSPIWNGNLNHRIKPQPKMVALGPEDVPPGSVFRRPEWEKGCHEAYQYVSANGVTFQNRHVSWEQVRNLDILRPGGNWQRCEKEETK